LKFVFEGDAENPDEIQKASLCGCKHNKPEKGPYCDGSHKNLAEW
jgi:CDGSH-type Zn-finger protein